MNLWKTKMTNGTVSPGNPNDMPMADAVEDKSEETQTQASDATSDSNATKDLQTPRYDENILENMSALLDRDIATLEKDDIFVYLRHYNSKFQYNEEKYPADDAHIDEMRKMFRSRVIKLRHHYINIPPTFLSHFTTNEQLMQMSMMDGIALIKKHSISGSVNINPKQLNKLHGTEIIKDCKRIRDTLRTLEGLPPFQEYNPLQRNTIPSKPSSRRNNLFKSTASNLNGTQLDDYLQKNNSRVSENNNFRVQPDMDAQNDYIAK